MTANASHNVQEITSYVVQRKAERDQKVRSIVNEVIQPHIVAMDRDHNMQMRELNFTIKEFQQMTSTLSSQVLKMDELMESLEQSNVDIGTNSDKLHIITKTNTKLAKLMGKTHLRNKSQSEKTTKQLTDTMTRQNSILKREIKKSSRAMSLLNKKINPIASSVITAGIVAIVTIFIQL